MEHRIPCEVLLTLIILNFSLLSESGSRSCLVWSLLFLSGQLSLTFLTFASISLFVNKILAYSSSKSGKIFCPLYLFRLGCLFFFFFGEFLVFLVMICVCVCVSGTWFIISCGMKGKVYFVLLSFLPILDLLSSGFSQKLI